MNDEEARERIRARSRAAQDRMRAALAASRSARVDACVALARRGDPLPPLPADEAAEVFGRATE